MKEKLELKHLAPYLPYKVTFQSEMDNHDGGLSDLPKWRVVGVQELFGDLCLITEKDDAYPIHRCKLLLRPLSDLVKSVECDGQFFVPAVVVHEICNGHIHGAPLSPSFIKLLNRCIANKSIRHEVMQKLLEWHFDVFDLIDKGLAINMNEV